MTTAANSGGERKRTVRPGRKMIEAVGTSSVNSIIQQSSECCSYGPKVSSFSELRRQETWMCSGIPPETMKTTLQNHYKRSQNW